MQKEICTKLNCILMAIVLFLLLPVSGAELTASSYFGARSFEECEINSSEVTFISPEAIIVPMIHALQPECTGKTQEAAKNCFGWGLLILVLATVRRRNNSESYFILTVGNEKCSYSLRTLMEYVHHQFGSK